MARVKRGVTSHQRHKRLLHDAEGRKGTRSQPGQAGARGAPPRAGVRHPRPQAAQAPDARALDHPHQRRRPRRTASRTARSSHGLKKADIELDRKILADLAVRDAPTFGRIVEVARAPDGAPAARRPVRRSRCEPSRGPAAARASVIPGSTDRRDRPESTRGPRRPDGPAASGCATRRCRGSQPPPTSRRSSELDVAYLGRKGGALTELLRGIGGLPPEDRPRVGAVANEVREAVEAALAEARAPAGAAALAARLAAEAVDVTRRRAGSARGTLHPILETIDAIEEIFGQFGFVVYEGPEVEDDVTNFQMLNIPPDHPARDLWDTLYVDIDDHLLRTHTSPGQIRVMRETRPPIRALLPGRCFRYEAVDASHAFEFFQVEGLMVDEGTNLADLKGLLDEFAHALFGADRATRFRPGYYPFTEPSVAFDVGCVVCDGAGCPACGRSGWMTILGAGMVHPVVLQYGGIDPERYQGFAFGMGVERIAMLRHGVHRPAPVPRERPPLPGAVPMRVPLSWLRDYVDVDLDARALAERLTLLGMEVKSDRAVGCRLAHRSSSASSSSRRGTRAPTGSRSRR